MTRPTMSEALAAQYQATAEHYDEQTRAAALDMTSDVRATADRIDAEPALLDLLGERQRNEVQRYRAWRAARDARAAKTRKTTTTGGDAA